MWDNCYKYRREITINKNDYVTLENFPVHVFINNRNFLQSDRLDLIFQQTLNNLKFCNAKDFSLLAFEVIEEDLSKKEGETVVKIPHLKFDGSDSFFMYYGLKKNYNFHLPIFLIYLWQKGEVVFKISKNGLVEKVDKDNLKMYCSKLKDEGFRGPALLEKKNESNFSVITNLDSINYTMEKYGLNKRSFNPELLVQFHKDIRDQIIFYDSVKPILDFFGKRWIDRKVNEALKLISKNSTTSLHPLICLWPLSMNPIKKNYNPEEIMFLVELGRNLVQIKKTALPSNLTKRLKNTDGFFGGAFEIKAANFLKSKSDDVNFRIPRGVKRQDYDLDITLDSKSIPVECTSKKEIKKLKKREGFKKKFKEKAKELFILTKKIEFNCDIEISFHRDVEYIFLTDVFSEIFNKVQRKEQGKFNFDDYMMEIKETFRHSFPILLDKIGGKVDADYSTQSMEINEGNLTVKSLKKISYKFDDEIDVAEYVIESYSKKKDQLPDNQIGIIMIELFDELSENYLNQISSALIQEINKSDKVGCVFLYYGKRFHEQNDAVRRICYRGIPNSNTPDFAKLIRKYF